MRSIHCIACDNIEKLFKELAELVRQLQRDRIHKGYTYDILFDAVSKKQNEITRYQNNISNYSRFLTYSKRIQDILQEGFWEQEDMDSRTISAYLTPKTI